MKKFQFKVFRINCGNLRVTFCMEHHQYYRKYLKESSILNNKDCWGILNMRYFDLSQLQTLKMPHSGVWCVCKPWIHLYFLGHSLFVLVLFFSFIIRLPSLKYVMRDGCNYPSPHPHSYIIMSSFLYMCACTMPHKSFHDVKFYFWLRQLIAYPV